MTGPRPGKKTYSPSFRAEEASAWRRIRKYAVPKWMIDQATERRLAGDWQGACTAANMDVVFDLDGIADQYGTEIAGRLKADLLHLAPDLARWHLPRYLRGRTTLRADQCVVLAGYGARFTDDPVLYATTSKLIEGPQRLTLRFGPVKENEYTWGRSQEQDWRLARHLWDARHSDELRERCGGDEHRVPFHHSDGTLLGSGELPERDPGPGDPPGRAEWVTLLCERGEIEQAFSVAGISVDDRPPPRQPYYTPPPVREDLAGRALALTRLGPEVRRLAEAGLGTRFDGLRPVFQIRDHNFSYTTAPIRVEPEPGGLGLRLLLDSHSGLRTAYPVPDACWRRLPDLDLLRSGAMTPAELHPLVSASLFPEREARPGDGPPGPSLPGPVRVRCRGEWHEVRSSGGRLQIPHSAEEQRREQALRALGGSVSGCFAAQRAWTSGTGRLPGLLREQRRELFSRVQHDDTPGVLQLLDAGVDPHIRDGRRHTLLHLLSHLDHEVLLPRLLEAGLDLEARDHYQRTPLHVAVSEGPTDLVVALLTAGARTDVRDHQDRTLGDEVCKNKREDLRFLAERAGMSPAEIAEMWSWSWRE